MIKIYLRECSESRDFNRMIHSRFDFHGTLQKMLQSTITMYQASEHQRLIEKKNYENVGISTVRRLEELEDENRKIKAEGLVDTEDLTLFETKATLSLGKVGMRPMIYKTGDICAVTPIWVHNLALLYQRPIFTAHKSVGFR